MQAFTCSKNVQDPGSNEDRLVIIPDRAFGVIDGVTDKSGVRYGGATGGQMAGHVIERAIRELVEVPGFARMPVQDIMNRINGEFARAYDSLGLTDITRTDVNRRFVAQLSLMLLDDEAYRFILVGDSGLRINGTEVHMQSSLADTVSARVRSEVYHVLKGKGLTDEICLTAAREFALDGLAQVNPTHEPHIASDELSTLRSRLRDQLPRAFPHHEPSLLAEFIDIGIRGQTRRRNTPGPGGFAAIDGSAIPDSLIESFTREAADVDIVEFFTDGYFGLGTGPTIEDWERRFAEIEQADPAKVNEFLSTKGSTAELFTDDRTVLIVEPRTLCTATV